MSKYGIFSGPYSVLIWENTDQRKLHIWTFLTQCLCNPSSKITFDYCCQFPHYSRCMTCIFVKLVMHPEHCWSSLSSQPSTFFWYITTYIINSCHFVTFCQTKLSILIVSKIDEAGKSFSLLMVSTSFGMGKDLLWTFRERLTTWSISWSLALVFGSRIVISLAFKLSHVRLFYPSTFVYSRFPQRFSFFTVCLVQWLRRLAPW